MARVALALFAIVVTAASAARAGSEGAGTSRAAASIGASVTATAAPARANAKRSAKLPTAKSAQRAAPRRAVVVQPAVPFASVGGVVLLHPAQRVERVGFHQASDVATRELSVASSAIRAMVLPSRSRPTGNRTAADIVVHPHSQVRAPVSGIVKRAGDYNLYCKHPDSFAVISPDGHPELEVKVLHISGRRVQPGDRVVAGKTVIAQHATKFPFRSQIDAFTRAPAWPHVHMEVTQLAVPNATPVVGASLTIGQCG